MFLLFLKRDFLLKWHEATRQGAQIVFQSVGYNSIFYLKFAFNPGSHNLHRPLGIGQHAIVGAKKNFLYTLISLKALLPTSCSIITNLALGVLWSSFSSIAYSSRMRSSIKHNRDMRFKQLQAGCIQFGNLTRIIFKGASKALAFSSVALIFNIRKKDLALFSISMFFYSNLSKN